MRFVDEKILLGIWRVVLILSLNVLLGVWGFAGVEAEPTIAPVAATELHPLMPLVFERNGGQFPAEYDFVVRSGGDRMGVSSQGITFASEAGDSGDALRIQWMNVDATASPEGLDALPTKTYYLSPGSRSAERQKTAAIENYARVRYNGLLPGVAVVLYGNRSRLEYDLELAQAKQVDNLRFRVTGADAVHVDEQGDLVIERRGLHILQRKPKVLQAVGGESIEVPSAYRRYSDGSFGFAVTGYDPEAPLVVDPIVELATVFGSDGEVSAYTPQLDAQGNLYLIGRASSSALPGESQPPLRLPGNTSNNLFVTKLAPDWSHAIFTTYISWATSYGTESSLALAPDGDLYLSYATTDPYTSLAHSVPLIGTSGVNPQLSGYTRTLVAKLAGDGASLRWYTAIGCDRYVVLSQLSVDSQSRAILGGSSSCTDWPTEVAGYRWGTPNANYGALFVLSLEPNGEAVRYAVRVAGSNTLGVAAMAVTAQDEVVVGGMVAGSFPVTANAYQSTLRQFGDTYFARFSSDGEELLASTLYGGNGSDEVRAMALDAQGGIAAALRTGSTDLPGTAGGFDPTLTASNYGSAVIRLRADLSALTWATYYPGVIELGDVFLEESGSVWLLGMASSSSGTGTPITANRLIPNTAWASIYLGRLNAHGSIVTFGSHIPGGYSSAQRVRFIGAPGGTVRILAGPYTQTLPVSEGATLPLRRANTPVEGVYLLKLNLEDPTYCQYSISPERQDVGWKGGMAEFDVATSAGCPWVASVSSMYGEQFTLLDNSGIGPGKVRVEVKPSTSSEYQLGVTLSLFDQYVELHQQVALCDEPTLTPSVLDFDAEGGVRSATFSIPNGCRWTAAVEDTWYSTSLTTMRGTGSFAVTISVPRNDFTARTSTLLVNGLPLRINQAAGACVATVQATPSSLPANGGVATVQLASAGAGCMWQATASSRVQLSSPSSGTGSATFTATLPANPTNITLTETIHVAGNSIHLEQFAGNCSASLGQDQTTVGKAGGSIYIAVTAEGDACAWYPQVDSSWIALREGYSFSGSGHLVADIAPNNTGEVRAGTVRILGKTLTVLQQAHDTVRLSVHAGADGVPFRLNGTPYRAPAQIEIAPGAHVTLQLDDPEFFSADRLLQVYERWDFAEGLAGSLVVPENGVNVSLIGQSYTGVRARSIGNASGDGSRVMLGANTPLYRVIGDWQYYYRVPLNSQYYGEVTLTAMPGAGSRFVKWVSERYGSTTTNPITYSLPWAVDVIAEFEPLDNSTPRDPGAMSTASPLYFPATVGVSETLTSVANIRRTGSAEVSFHSAVQCLGQPEIPFVVSASGNTTPFAVTVYLDTARLAGYPSGQYEDCSLVLQPNAVGQGRLVIPLVLTIAERGNEPHILYPVDAAGYQGSPLAVGAIASVFGTALAEAAEGADSLPLPTKLRGAQLYLRRGTENVACPLFYVSPGQINFLIPADYPDGDSLLVLYRDGVERNAVPLNLIESRPSLFTANATGEGAAAGFYIHVNYGVQQTGPLAECPGSGACVPHGIGAPDDPDGQTYLTLYGTGLRFAGGAPNVTIGGVPAVVTYSGEQGHFVGLDQLNVRVPKSVLTMGSVEVVVTVGSLESNHVTVRF